MKTLTQDGFSQVVVPVDGAILHLVKVPGCAFKFPCSWRPLPRKLTDTEAGKVVLPKWGLHTEVGRYNDSLGHRSDGTGRFWQPPSDFAFEPGEARRRYIAEREAHGHTPSPGATDEGGAA